MTQPIMRFNDKYNRRGIAFHIEYNDDESRGSGVLAIFQRYSNQSKYVHGIGGDQKIGHCIRSLKENIEPISDETLLAETISNLLIKRDPIFKIGQDYNPAKNRTFQEKSKKTCSIM